MPQFIKLTGIEDGEPVLVQTAKIISVESKPEYSMIYLTASSYLTVDVTETVEEIAKLINPI